MSSLTKNVKWNIVITYYVEIQTHKPLFFYFKYVQINMKNIEICWIVVGWFQEPAPTKRSDSVVLWFLRVFYFLFWNLFVLLILRRKKEHFSNVKSNSHDSKISKHRNVHFKFSEWIQSETQTEDGVPVVLRLVIW